ncbi:MAG: hypothetical protein C5B56_11935 [Proteobacteria bacterium]|nr:MAG: hypothetical protein C5B56_11935 [Pseudomonadota bacterium]
MRRYLYHLGIYLIAAAVGFLAVEAAYRVLLLKKYPRIQLRAETDEELPLIGAYNRSLWRFDAVEGFQYVRGQIFNTHVRNGRILACEPVPPRNKYGMPGLAEGDYEDAEIKLAVFGDSFSLFTDASNANWVNYLQRTLQARLGRSVHVLNFARDGSGFVQMFDIAAAKLPEVKPDLAIIAFATNNVAAPRIWRVEKVINGELRVVTEFEPAENPDLGASYETYILHPEAEGAWCEAHKNGGDLDRVGREIIDKYRRFRPARYSAFTPYRSFVWHRIVHADPFYSEADRRFGVTVSAPEIATDARLMASVKALDQSGIPYIIVHLPYAAEVAAGSEYIFPSALDIVREVERLTRHPALGLLEHIGLPVSNPERMSFSAEDTHPSTWGMQLYADAVAKIVMENGFEGRRAR